MERQEMNNRKEIARKLVEAAKQLVAMPLVYETINGIKYYINNEKKCQHYEAHVHVVDGDDEAVFSLRDGRKLIGSIKHENDVLQFLQNTSNRRRLLRRYKNWQEKGRCSFLVNPVI